MRDMSEYQYRMTGDMPVDSDDRSAVEETGNMIHGCFIAIVVSAAFWTGVALVLHHFV